VYLTLRNPTGGLGLAAPHAATLDIDPALPVFPPDQVLIADGPNTVAENAGSFSFTIIRQGLNTTVTVSVGYTVEPGANNPASGTVVFGPGETVKTVTIPIVDDQQNEIDHFLNIDLSPPQGPAVLLAGGDTFRVKVLEERDPAQLQFSVAAYQAA